MAEFGGRGNVLTIVSALDAASRAIGLGAWEHPWYYPGIGEYAPLLERAGLEVTNAFLFDRPTLLEGEEGMRHWVEMFAGGLLDRVTPADREGFFRHVEDSARPTLYRDGKWFADYRRLRIVARRADELRGCEKIGRAFGVKSRTSDHPGCGWRAKPRAMFWAMANHVATDLTFSRPRTMNCRRPRLRAWALTHSAVAALSL